MLTIDESLGRVVVRHPDGSAETHDLASPEAFEAVSAAWLRCGWDVKYVYGFTWMGRPVIQLPEDMIRVQEVVWQLRPDVIVETGVAHGGSLIFYASLFAAMDHGRVIGVDVDICQHNRAAIEAHPLARRITLIEGNSTAAGTLAAVRHGIAPNESVLVVLDSNHSRAHVEAELDLYAQLVTRGSYIVACDGIMAQFAGAPRSAPDWTWNNPVAAVDAFLARNTDFALEEPGFLFNEGSVRSRVTYWPNSFLKRH
jgi:cephalosporin hydroxylase